MGFMIDCFLKMLYEILRKSQVKLENFTLCFLVCNIDYRKAWI